VLLFALVLFARIYAWSFALQESEWVSWIKKTSPMFASLAQRSDNDDVDEDGRAMGFHVGKWSLSQLRE